MNWDAVQTEDRVRLRMRADELQEPVPAATAILTYAQIAQLLDERIPSHTPVPAHLVSDCHPCMAILGYVRAVYSLLFTSSSFKELLPSAGSLHRPQDTGNAAGGPVPKEAHL